jgi:hypothetical protein
VPGGALGLQGFWAWAWGLGLGAWGLGGGGIFHIPCFIFYINVTLHWLGLLVASLGAGRNATSIATSMRRTASGKVPLQLQLRLRLRREIHPAHLTTNYR